jgi:hypothetical protein
LQVDLQIRKPSRNKVQNVGKVSKNSVEIIHATNINSRNTIIRR